MEACKLKIGEPASTDTMLGDAQKQYFCLSQGVESDGARDVSCGFVWSMQQAAFKLFVADSCFVCHVSP